MIGIPILDSQSTEMLALIALGEHTIYVAEKPSLETSLDPDALPEPEQPLRLMCTEKVKHLCRMEIESRLGMEYLADRIKNLQSQ